MSGMKKVGSLPTATDGHDTFNFDGIFRDVNRKETRDRLYAAQKLVSEGKWQEAKDSLKRLISEVTDQHDNRNLRMILQEIELYEERHIEPSVVREDVVNWTDVCKRRTTRYFERWDELPQSIFLLKSWEMEDGSLRVLVGRRLLSHQWIANKIRELHCSHVRASMILGVFVDFRIQDDGVVVFYRPLTPPEKKTIMHDIVHKHLQEMELVYPFPALQTEFKTEIHCPDEGWEIDETLALQLGEGEIYLRDFSVEFLKALKKDELYLYDPACSTGQFLATMKESLPKSYTAGQDLSYQMTIFAAKRVDEVHHGNAADPKIPDNTADVVFIRFINSEVLKAADARQMIRPLVRVVKPGGHIVIFGHTPVLVSSADLIMDEELEVLQCMGGDPKWDGVFQYYVCKKT